MSEAAKKRTFKDSRARELALIHIAKKELGLDDDTYRDCLEAQGGVRSAADLTALGRAKVLRHFERCGWHPPRPRKARPVWQKCPKPSQGRGPMITKIDALLYEAGRDRTYAMGMIKQMFGPGAPDRLEWATPEQLHKVVAALVYDAKRHGRSG